MSELVLCKEVVCVGKIFTTVSSTAFVHMQHYNHHEMTVPEGALEGTCFCFSLLPVAIKVLNSENIC